MQADSRNGDNCVIVWATSFARPKSGATGLNRTQDTEQADAETSRRLAFACSLLERDCPARGRFRIMSMTLGSEQTVADAADGPKGESKIVSYRATHDRIGDRSLRST
jgi:hypothetical protein